MQRNFIVRQNILNFYKFSLNCFLLISYCLFHVILLLNLLIFHEDVINFFQQDIFLLFLLFWRSKYFSDRILLLVDIRFFENSQHKQIMLFQIQTICIMKIIFEKTRLRYTNNLHRLNRIILEKFLPAMNLCQKEYLFLKNDICLSLIQIGDNIIYLFLFCVIFIFIINSLYR